MTNREVILILREIADMLQVQGADVFRYRSYQRAADTVRGLTEDLADLRSRGELETLPGVGKAISAKIDELYETGSIQFHQELLTQFPPGLLAMLTIPEFGPKSVQRVFEELGVDSVDALEQAAREQRLRALKGFGAKTEEKLLANIARWRVSRERVLAAHALRLAEPLRERLAATDGVQAISLAGSLRRGRETTKDVDLLIAADDGGPAIAAFCAWGDVQEVTGRGETKASVQLHGGLNSDLRVVPPTSWGAALQYFTGSKAHNIALRSRARERGLTINEYGVYRLGDEAGEPVASVTEEDVYAAVGLPWIPPELREDRGEIAAAEAGWLPDLLEVADIRGDLHNHSTWSDGRQTIVEMARAARARGYEYFAICDHSQSLVIANGLDEGRVRQQWREIASAQEAVPELRLLRGIEVDILTDGRLDLPLDLLAELDLVVASVHSGFQMGERQMTDRLLTALSTGVIDVLGHPTGRLLTRREGFGFVFDEVVDAAVAQRVALEINAAPERLDLDEVMARRARQRGALIAINTDAHHLEQLDNLRFGVQQARRAWLGPSDILNTRSTADLLDWLEG